jgi:hypothetical protein
MQPYDSMGMLLLGNEPLHYMTERADDDNDDDVFRNDVRERTAVQRDNAVEQDKYF